MLAAVKLKQAGMRFKDHKDKRIINQMCLFGSYISSIIAFLDLMFFSAVL